MCRLLIQRITSPSSEGARPRRRYYMRRWHCIPKSWEHRDKHKKERRMLRRIEALGILTAAAVVMTIFPPKASAQAAGPAAWQNDLKPIAPADWNYDFAAHLLERAGFGGTPTEIQALTKLTPAQAVAQLVRFQGTDASR